jgi:hypothetical protein
VYVLFFPNQKEIHKNSKLFKNIPSLSPLLSLPLPLPVYPFQISVANWMKFVTNYPIQKLKTKET